MLTFTAIDYETATSARGSACSVGWAVVRDGHLVHSQHEYIYPPTGLEFTNSWLHGITAEHVENARQWHDVMYELIAANPGAPLVAYSAFDRSVWNAAWALNTQVHPPHAEFLDALALARRSLKLQRYRLPDVASALNVPSFNHHNAEDDALACARIVLEIGAAQGATHMRALWPAYRG